MNVGIIGCGLIGKKRASALCGSNLLWAVDTDLSRAKIVASLDKNAKASTEVSDVFNDPNVDIVVIATTNDSLSELSVQAAKAKKHVLVEKPAGRSVSEIDQIISVSQENKVLIKVGFNHRYHPALLKAKEIVDSGVMGPLMFIRGRYGHGGRVGYEKEWRANPKISGGGELIDQGVHLIDLARWFLGNFQKVEGYAGTYFWKMPVDDNAFMQLRNENNQMAWLHVSCTEWKNMFSFEIYGRDGKISIDGLGGSYGTEKLTYYQMLPEMGPPETTAWEYSLVDKSWQREFQEFIDAIKQNRNPCGDIVDAREALIIVEKIYEVSK